MDLNNIYVKAFNAKCGVPVEVKNAFFGRYLSPEQETAIRNFLIQRVASGLSHTVFLEGIGLKFGPIVASRIWNKEIQRKAEQSAQNDSTADVAPNGAGANKFDYYQTAYAKLEPEQLQAKLANINLGDIPDSSRDASNRVILRKRGKQWIKQMFYVLAKQGVDTQFFLDKISGMVGAEHMQEMKPAIDKALAKATELNAKMQNESFDAESDFLFELTNHMKVSDIPGVSRAADLQIRQKFLTPESVAWLQDKLRRILAKNLPCLHAFMIKITEMFKDDLLKVFNKAFRDEVIKDLLPKFTHRDELMTNVMRLAEDQPAISESLLSYSTGTAEEVALTPRAPAYPLFPEGFPFPPAQPAESQNTESVSDPYGLDGFTTEIPESEVSSEVQKLYIIEMHAIPGLVHSLDPMSRPKMSETCHSWLRQKCFFLAQHNRDLEPFVARLKLILDETDFTEFQQGLWKIVQRADQLKCTASKPANFTMGRAGQEAYSFGQVQPYADFSNPMMMGMGMKSASYLKRPASMYMDQTYGYGGGYNMMGGSGSGYYGMGMMGMGNSGMPMQQPYYGSGGVTGMYSGGQSANSDRGFGRKRGGGVTDLLRNFDAKRFKKY